MTKETNLMRTIHIDVPGRRIQSQTSLKKSSLPRKDEGVNFIVKSSGNH